MNIAMLAELGIFPIAIDEIKASVGYWFHLVYVKEQSYAKNANKCSTNISIGFAAKIKCFQSQASIIYGKFKIVFQKRN